MKYSNKTSNENQLSEDLFDSHWLKEKYPDRFERVTLSHQYQFTWINKDGILKREFPYNTN